MRVQGLDSSIILYGYQGFYGVAPVCWYNAQEEEEEGKEQRGGYCGTTDGSEVTTKAK